MSATHATTAERRPAPAKKAAPAARPRPEASDSAKKLAAAILEVLAGARSTGSAAEALGISLPRYYALEARAIEGLVSACEPRKSRGRQRSPTREIEVLRLEKERLERECARHQALARAAQRTLGLSPPPAREEKKKGGRKTRKRLRKPLARGLAAAAALAPNVAKPVTSSSAPAASAAT